MKLARDANFGDRTANEQIVSENQHTFASYSFATYCEAREKEKSHRYFEEEFNLSECREVIFGTYSNCDRCEKTGWIPVSNTNMAEPLRSLWMAAEVDVPAADGYHIVPCPYCCGVNDGSKDVKPFYEELDEHIVKKGSQFELKSKKTGKNLGTYPSKAGAKKREGQVEYFKHLKEDGGGNPFKTHWEQATLPGTPDQTPDYPKKINEEDQPSDYNRKQSSEKKDEKAQEKHGENGEKKMNDNRLEWEKKKKASDKKHAEEKERATKKLLPYEFTNQKDAERAAGHLGIHGSHTTGNGIYKPGSSDMSLRDAVSRKKSKQKNRHGFHEDKEFDRSASAVRGDSHDAYPLDKANIHETLQIIKECVIYGRQ